MKRVLVGRAGVVGGVVMSGALTLAGCKDPVVIEGAKATVHVDIRAASAPDALAGNDPVSSFAVTLYREDPPADPFQFFVGFDGTVVDADGLPAPTSDLGPAARARVHVWGMTPAGLAYSFGRSAPFALPAEGVVEVPVFLAVPGGFSDAGAPRLARAGGEAVPLGDGRVLAVGGRDAAGLLAAATYEHGAGSDEEVSGGFYAMHPAVCALAGGRALVAGGEGDDGALLDGVWLFDGAALARVGTLPSGVRGARLACSEEGQTGYVVGGMDAAGARADIVAITIDGDDVTVSVGPNGAQLTDARAFPSLTPMPLDDATAFLVAGGIGAGGEPLASAEVLEVSASGDVVVKPLVTSGHPSASVDLGTPRFAHAAVLLSSTSVLLYGGADAAGPLPEPRPLVFSAEISDPGAFVPLDLGATASLAAPRAGGSAARLSDGVAVIAGGAEEAAPALLVRVPAGQSAATATALDATVSELAAGVGRAGGSALLLDDDSVLVTGGRADGDVSPDAAASTAEPAPAELLVLCHLDDRCEP